MKVPVERYWGLTAVDGVRSSGPAPDVVVPPPPSADGVTPEAGYSVTGSFAAGGEITITKSGGGFGSRPAGFPAPLHFDTVDEWWDNGVLKTPYQGMPLDVPVSSSETTPYGSMTNIRINEANPLPFRSRHYASEIDGDWSSHRVDNFRSFGTGRAVNTGELYFRYWIHFGPEFMNLLYSAPEKPLRIWEPSTDINLRLTIGVLTYFNGNGIHLNRNNETQFPSRGEGYGTAWNSPARPGWNLLEHYCYLDGVGANSRASSRINGVLSGYVEGGVYWRNWPLNNGGATPRGCIWAGNNQNLPPGSSGKTRTGGEFGLFGPDKWIHSGDIYCDITQQRVEIGSAAGLYTHNGKRNLLLVSSWSDTQIIARLFETPSPNDRLYWVDALDGVHLAASFT